MDAGQPPANRPPDVVLRHARGAAAVAGIDRVAELPDPDGLGVWVFAARRPQARGDVHAFGKGFDPAAAEVGAYLEALEGYHAEPGVGCVPSRRGTARDVPGGDRADDAVLEFGPRLGRVIDLDEPLPLAAAHDVETGAVGWLPAEVVFFPPADGPGVFGGSTAGLAAGTSVAAATAHALLELIERDVWSFELVRDSSRPVAGRTLPDEVREVGDRARRRGLGLAVRTVPTEYGLPFFAAFLFDEGTPRRATFNGGWGCHPDRHTAVVRAVTEAVQSRLAFFHGLRVVPPPPPDFDDGDEAGFVRRHVRAVCDDRGAVAFADVPDPGPGEGYLGALIGRLRRVTPRPVYRVELTPPGAPVAVVRVVVPTLENVQDGNVRIGPRLHAAVAAGVA